MFLKLMEYKLKVIYRYDEMETNRKIDFDDEVNSFIPSKIQDEFAAYFKNFKECLSTNTKHSLVQKKLFLIFGDSWPLFVYLLIIFSFRRNSEETYSNSQTIFWRCVEILRNFFITTEDLDFSVLNKKINVFLHVSIKVLSDIGLIKEKKNYIEIKKDRRPGETYHKNVIHLRVENFMIFDENFNVSQKFFRSPLKVYDYKIDLGDKKSKYSRSIISGPTFVRSEVYDKNNPYGNEIFKIKNNNLRTVFSEIKFYVDVEFIKHIKNKFFNHLNKEEIEENIKKVKKEMENIYEKTNWNQDTIEKKKEIQKKYATLLEERKCDVFLAHDWAEHYYLSTSNDYRGRRYYCSPLTFTHFKLSRYCFHYGYQGSIQENFFDWTAYVEIFKKILEEDKCQPFIEIIGFYLIGMGKLDNSRKEKIETSLKEILEKGINFYLEEKNIIYEKLKKDWNNLKLKKKIDAIELECYRFGLKKYLKGDKTKRIILKDATASGYQIQSSLVGSKNHDCLKYVNLGQEQVFVDTYLFIADCFKKSVKDEFPVWAEKYFKRDIIKKFCMIIPYSAGWEECFSNIKEYINEDEKIKATLLFNLFYNFIKKDLWKYLGFKKSFSEVIKEKAENGDFYAKSETAEANFEYYTQSEKEIDTRYKNMNGDRVRTTRLYRVNTQKIDKRQTMTSLSPNLTHFHDADIIRILHLEPYNLKFASIHDAFVISSFDCGKLVHSYGNIFKIKIRFHHKPPVTSLL